MKKKCILILNTFFNIIYIILDIDLSKIIINSLSIIDVNKPILTQYK